MRRLLYFLLGSTLFHGALLWVPFPMSAGGAREDALQVVRVRLVDPPRTEASKPTGQPRAPRRRDRPRPQGRRRQRSRGLNPGPGPRWSRCRPKRRARLDSEPGQVKTVAKKPPKRVRPEPAKPRRTETAAKAAENPRITAAGVTARKPARRDGSGEKPQLARGVAPAASAGGDIQTTVDLESGPVRTDRKAPISPEGAPGRLGGHHRPQGTRGPRRRPRPGHGGPDVGIRHSRRRRGEGGATLEIPPGAARNRGLVELGQGPGGVQAPVWLIRVIICAFKLKENR